MRVAVVWKGMSGYLEACLQALASRPGSHVQLFHLPAQDAAPYDHSRFEAVGERHVVHTTTEADAILRTLRTFTPELVLFSSWNIPAFRRVALRLRGQVPRILCMDNQWLATPKQVAGVILSPVLIRPLFDGVFLPGEPQARFARRLGFTESRTWRGLYSCDHDRFRAARQSREPRLDERRFVFVGRLVKEKGIDVLAEAYAAYRLSADGEPWQLHLYGTGPLDALLRGRSGVTVHGFVQPDQLPAVLTAAGASLLPSRFEPWGVAIHEAATAGLPVIASTACGAAVHLVQDRYNGFLVDPGGMRGLADAMARVTRLSADERQRFGERSAVLAEQFTPARWADAVQDMWATAQNW